MLPYEHAARWFSWAHENAEWCPRSLSSCGLLNSIPSPALKPSICVFSEAWTRRLLFLSGVSSRPPSFLSSSLPSPQHAPSSGLLLTGQGSTMFHFFLSSLHQCSDYPSGWCLNLHPQPCLHKLETCYLWLPPLHPHLFIPQTLQTQWNSSMFLSSASYLCECYHHFLKGPEARNLCVILDSSLLFIQWIQQA